jgi:hypothetical protein
MHEKGKKVHLLPYSFLGAGNCPQKSPRNFPLEFHWVNYVHMPVPDHKKRSGLDWGQIRFIPGVQAELTSPGT